MYNLYTITKKPAQQVTDIVPINSNIIHVHGHSAKESYVTIFILLHCVFTLLNKDNLRMFIAQLKYNY